MRQDPCGSAGLRGGELDVEARTGAALARVLAAASSPTAVLDLEGEERGQVGLQRAEDAATMDDGDGEDNEVAMTSSSEAPSVRPGTTEMAERAHPKRGEVETCRYWAKGWCMGAYACRFAHPQPPVPPGAHQHLLLDLGAVPWVGTLVLGRSARQEELLRDVVEAAQGGGQPAVGHVVGQAGRVVWAVVLPCGTAALLTPFSGGPM